MYNIYIYNKYIYLPKYIILKIWVAPITYFNQ